MASIKFPKKGSIGKRRLFPELEIRVNEAENPSEHCRCKFLSFFESISMTDTGCSPEPTNPLIILASIFGVYLWLCLTGSVTLGQNTRASPVDSKHEPPPSQENGQFPKTPFRSFAANKIHIARMSALDPLSSVGGAPSSIAIPVSADC